MSLFPLKLEPNSMSKLELYLVLLRQETNCKYLFLKSKDLLSNQYALGTSLESKSIKIARHDSCPSRVHGLLEKVLLFIAKVLFVPNQKVIIEIGRVSRKDKD